MKPIISVALMISCFMVEVQAIAQEQAPQATTSAETGEAGEPDEPPPALIEVDPSVLKMPTLSLRSTPEIEADYDKFFYFHRENTSFIEAYADIKECDALASGMSFYLDGSAGQAAAAQYGALAGAIGSAIGTAIADAIVGAAERRKMRRVNLRNCMWFKEYKRYGLSEPLWREFNFTEGNGRKREAVREEALQRQALVASGPKPDAKDLGI